MQLKGGSGTIVDQLQNEVRSMLDELIQTGRILKQSHVSIFLFLISYYSLFVLGKWNRFLNSETFLWM